MEKTVRVSRAWRTIYKGSDREGQGRNVKEGKLVMLPWGIT